MSSHLQIHWSSVPILAAGSGDGLTGLAGRYLWYISPMRADSLLRNLYPGLTRRQVAEAFDSGLVRAVGTRASLRKNESINGIMDFDRAALDAHLAELEKGRDVEGIRVLATGPAFLVLHKPAGVASVPLSLMDQDTVTAWARFHYPEVNEAFSSVQPELAVHRLDTDTEGVLVVALNSEKHQSWRELFARHEVEKQYRAWVWGIPSSDSLSLVTALTVVPGRAKVSEARNPSDASTIAEARVKKLRVDEARGISEVLVTTRSGIRHQVRAQLAFAGFPLIGDRSYDAQYEARAFQHPHHLLWASRLQTGLGTWEDLPPSTWGVASAD